MQSDRDQELAIISVPGERLTPPRPGERYRVYVFRTGDTLTLEVAAQDARIPEASAVPGRLRIESGNATTVLDVLRALAERLDGRPELRDALDNPERWSIDEFRSW